MDINTIAQRTQGKLPMIALASGIAAAVIGIMPLMISWFVCLRIFVWLFAIIAVAAIAFAFYQKENVQAEIVKYGAAVVLAVLAILVPKIFKVKYYTAKMNYAIDLQIDVMNAISDEDMAEDMEKATEKAIKKLSRATTKMEKRVFDDED